MKKFIFRVLTCIAVLIPFKGMATDFGASGLKYEVISESDRTCAIIKADTAYAVDLVVPEKVMYNSKEYTVTEVGPNAFDLCTSMNSLVLPASIKVIRSEALFRPTKLKFLTFLGTTPPDISVSPIATAIYSGCTTIVPTGCFAKYVLGIPRMYNIVEVGYKDYTTQVDGMKISWVTVSEQDKLCKFKTISPKPTGNFVMPDEVELDGVKYKVAAVGNSAFLSATGLTGVTLSKNLITIGASAFSKCSVLKSIEIPEGVTVLNTSIFNYCTAMESCKLPSTLKRMESNIYAYCSSLKRIDLPKGILYMGQSQFANCSSLETVTGFEDVDSIAGMMFGYCKSLKNVKFPTSSKIQSVPGGTFQGCSSLESIKLGDNVKLIDLNAFTGCSKLKDINIPEGVTALGASAFGKDSALVNIKLPAGLVSLGSNVFNGCVSLENIELPEGIVKLPLGAFSGCKKLKTVVIKGKLTEIGTGAFASCVELEPFEIPSTVTSILGTAFSRNDKLVSVKIPETVTNMGTGVFQYCANLESAELPSTIKVIPASTFISCKKLKKVKISDEATELGNYVFKFTGLDSIDLPNSITKFGNQVFFGDSSLVYVKLPESLTTIGKESFRNCVSLPEITLPENVESLDDLVFTACAKLKKVNSYNTTPPTILATTFDESTYASAMLVVPESAQNAYKSDQYWKQFSQFGTLGISNVESEGWYVVGKGFIESTVPVTVYTITGASVGTFTGYKAVAPGIYIISNGNKVAKVVVR